MRNMKQEKYERTELDIIKFETEDILSLSNPDEYELEKNSVCLPKL